MKRKLLIFCALTATVGTSAQIAPNNTSLPNIVTSYTANGGAQTVGPGSAQAVENTLALDTRPPQFLFTCGSSGTPYNPAAGQYVLEATCTGIGVAATGLQVRDSANNIIQIGAVTVPSIRSAILPLTNCSATGSDWSQVFRDQQCVLPVPSRPTGLGIYQSLTSQSCGSSGCALTLPNAPIANDLLTVVLSCPGNTVVNPPTGWTKFGEQVGPSDGYLAGFYHLVGSSEGSTYNFSVPNYGCSALLFDEWANAQPSISQSVFNTTSTTTLTPATPGSMAVAIGAQHSGYIPTATGWSNVTSGGDGQYHSVAVARYASPITTSAVSATWNTTSGQSSGEFLIAPYIATPTFVAGTGAGSTPPSITVDSGSNATSGGFTVTVASGAASGTFFTATYANPLTTAPFGCRLTPRNDASAALANSLSQLTSTTTAFSYRVASALTSGGALSFAYGCQ